jgi:hypothetical protein
LTEVKVLSGRALSALSRVDIDASMSGKVVLLGLIMVAMHGCGSMQPRTAPSEDGPVDWVALAGSWPGMPWRATQLVTLTWLEDETMDVRVELEVEAGRLAALFSSLQGIPLYLLEVRNGRLEARPMNAQLREMPADLFLADFVLAYWPPEVLENAFRASSWVFRSAGDRREVVDADGRLRVSVEEQRETENRPPALLVSHTDIPLAIRIRTIERARLR